jgi:hypothetical protein
MTSNALVDLRTNEVLAVQVDTIPITVGDSYPLLWVAGQSDLATTTWTYDGVNVVAPVDALAEQKTRTKANLAEFTLEKEAQGIVYLGVTVQTDRDSQSLIASLRVQAQEAIVAATPFEITWKGTDGFLVLNAAETVALSDAVNEWVNDTATEEKRISDLIDAAATELDAFEFEYVDEWSIDPLTDTDWIQKGNTFDIVTSNYSTIAFLSPSQIAVIEDITGELRTYTFNGSTDWAQTGNGLSLPLVAVSSITGLSSNRIALIDSSNDELVTYDFDGTDWAQVGNGLSIANSGTPYVAGLSSNRVALTDGSTSNLMTYDFDGTDWAQVGNTLNVFGGFLSIAGMSGNRITAAVGFSGELRTYDFDGTDWAQVGNGLNVVLGDASVAYMTGTRVAYIDNVGDELRTYDWDGSDFAQVGNGLSIPIPAGAVNRPAMAGLAANRIVIIDTTDTDMRTYDFV